MTVRNVTFDVLKNWSDPEVFVENGWIEARFWERRVINDFYVKSYYTLWRWADRSAQLWGKWYEKQSTLPLRNIPVDGKVALYAEAYSDRSTIEVWARVRLSDKAYQELKNLIEAASKDKTKIRELAAKIAAMIIIASGAEGPEGELANLIAFAAIAGGVANIVCPVYKKITIYGKDRRFVTVDLGNYAWCLTGADIYIFEWGFSVNDDAGCDGCLFDWCWGCQTVEEPSLHAGVGIKLYF